MVGAFKSRIATWACASNKNDQNGSVSLHSERQHEGLVPG